MKEYTCILCPRGCELKAEWIIGAQGEKELKVTGNFCPRGVKYATEEETSPMRTVTTSVYVQGGEEKMLSVKTADTVPKGKVAEVLAEASLLRPSAPVFVGDVLAEDIAGTGVSLVATRRVEASA